MKPLVSKYSGSCSRCGKQISVGSEVMYEKYTGIFCVGCEPTTPEEIRSFRKEKAARKAERYEKWAKQREEEALKVLQHNREHYTSDIAFNTQPGHFPLRERVIFQNDRACKSLAKAAEMREKADSLRNKVRVRGDAEVERQRKRDLLRPKLSKGMTVYCPLFGDIVISRVNKKTVSVKGPSGSSMVVDISYLRLKD